MNKLNSGTIAIVGGGPASLMLLKNIVESKARPKTIFIFEKNDRLGVGMPYGKFGSGKEHVANISANELPAFKISFEEYLLNNHTGKFPDFSVDGTCNPYQVIPRLLLGDYLEYQFKYYIDVASNMGMEIIARTETCVNDIMKSERGPGFNLLVNEDEKFSADRVMLCTGHHWPRKNEAVQPGWYDSPYPPSKFTSSSNFPIAIRGTSLTAVDALRTQSRLNGTYEHRSDGTLGYKLKKGSENFRIDLFSTGGFLPALRFHSEEDSYSNDWVMSLQEIYEYKNAHSGFVDLDHVFNINFKLPLQKKDPEFYSEIKDLGIEAFVQKMMSIRKELDSFKLFKAEYAEAEKSIKRRQSISWKEVLSAFSYSMNYPAKHFSAEDMLRLQKTLLPLISIIIASLPQSSYREIIALYDAGIIDLIQVDKKSYVEPHQDTGGIYNYISVDNKKEERHYQLFIDAIGQRPLELSDLPFESLKSDKLVSTAFVKFRNQEYASELLEKEEDKIYHDSDRNYYLQVHRLEINDYFQSLTSYGEIVENLFIMAVPFIGGLNPDYSGLDFCDTAGERILERIDRTI